VRALAARDLEAVLALDAAAFGRTRRAYFERRVAAARRDPERHLQLAAEESGRLTGYMLGRALEGEFGRSEPALRLESFAGAGAALAGAFEQEAARRGLQEIRTTALWRDHAALAFLDRGGYRLAPVYVLERSAAPDLAPQARDAFEIRVLQESDIEGMTRIDRRLTGRERRGYLCRTLGETLADSAVRVSLAAYVDGGVAGFLMARMDYGDFARAEPAAVIDTLGVDPLRARQGIGRALLSQLLFNLAALGVERAETAVDAGSQGLLGFFHAAGFRPCERLSFVKLLR
jgi:predicted N-acetyltransferase YhbS